MSKDDIVLLVKDRSLPIVRLIFVTCRAQNIILCRTNRKIVPNHRQDVNFTIILESMIGHILVNLQGFLIGG